MSRRNRLNRLNRLNRVFAFPSIICLGFAWACLDDNLAKPPTTPEAPSAPEEDLGEPPHMLKLAREIPGFAGFFHEPGGDRIVVAMTETEAAGFATARQAVSAILATSDGPTPTSDAPRPEFVERVVEYPFIELARHRARLRSRVFGIPGVASLSVDEEFNRIKIGIVDFSVRAEVVDLAAEMAVPLEMLSFAQTSYIRPMRGPVEPGSRAAAPRWPSLQDRIAFPDGRLRGGYQISSPRKWRPLDESGCTLGFTARRITGESGRKVFVSASHCSGVPWNKDNDWWHQDGRGPFVGKEVLDPMTTRCKRKRRLRPDQMKDCREADATMVGVGYWATDTIKYQDSIDIALGQIGRTTAKSNCDQCQAPREIDTLNSTIRITSQDGQIVDNETLHKIGMASGWTYGGVEDTCVDREIKDSDVLIRCTDRVDFSAKPGDSGAPVFEYSEWDGTAQLRGIVIGWQGGWWNDAIMSNLTQIFKDLGEMWAYDPGLPEVEIKGPEDVPPDWRCYWEARPVYGMTPFEKRVWSGVLNDTTDLGIAGFVEEAGWLHVETTDLAGRVARDSLYVNVVEGGTCPKPPGGGGNGGGGGPGDSDDPLR